MENPAPLPRMKLLLATIFTLTVIEFLQSGMLAFGASPISGQINASPEEYSIVTAAYAAVAITAIAKMRWFIERLGWRRFILLSIAFFLTGAGISALATSFPQFLLGRLVMGMGGAAFMTSARMLVNLIPPSPARIKGIIAFALGLSCAISAAPWIVAQFVGADWWNGIFVLLAALALLAAFLAAITLPDEPLPEESHTHAHFGPLLVMAGGSFLALFAVQRALYDFYSTLPYLLALAAAGVAAVVWFAWHQHGHERPLLRLRQLARRRYLTALGVFTVGYMVLGANNTMLPSLVQRALGFPWHVAGTVQAIGLTASIGVFFLKLRIIRTAPSPQKFYVAGFGALALFGWLLSGLTLEADLWRHVLPAIGLYGMFIVLILATTAIHGFTEFQDDPVAFFHAQQVKNMLAQFGTALGVAGANLLLQWRTAEHYAVLNRRFVSGDVEMSRQLEQLGTWFASANGAHGAAQLALGQLAQTLNQQAALLAQLEYFRLLVFVGLGLAALMAWQRTLSVPRPA